MSDFRGIKSNQKPKNSDIAQNTYFNMYWKIEGTFPFISNTVYLLICHNVATDISLFTFLIHCSKEEVTQHIQSSLEKTWNAVGLQNIPDEKTMKLCLTFVHCLEVLNITQIILKRR